MKSSTPAPWPSRNLKNEQVLEHQTPDRGMLFGLGPPLAAAPPEARTEGLLAALGPDVRAIRWGEQIHGRLVASLAPEPDRPFTGVGCVGRCDALITDQPGLGLLVWSADCVPILLSGGGVVAAVHSGWRGTAADVVGAVVHRFRSEFGVPADSLEAALGPAISGPHYEVSDQVIEALSLFEIDHRLWREDKRVDLRRLIAGRLLQLGVSTDRTVHVGGCTAESLNLASYRRDGADAGRQWSMVYRRG